MPVTRLFRAVAVVGLALAAPHAAPAQTRTCAERAQVIERLAERYGETLQSMGMNSNNGLLEVYASEETGSWTILVTSPDGTACLVAAGQMWEGDARPLTKPGKDALTIQPGQGRGASSSPAGVIPPRPGTRSKLFVTFG
jgi:hypothetical protein